MPKIPKKQAAPRSISKAKYSASKKSMSTPAHVPRTETRGTEHRGAGKKNEWFEKLFPVSPIMKRQAETMKKQAETTVKKSVKPGAKTSQPPKLATPKPPAAKTRTSPTPKKKRGGKRK